jgi:hypothetical protein
MKNNEHLSINKVIDFEKKYDYSDESICRVHTSVYKKINAKRRTWITITVNGYKIFRRIRGHSADGFLQNHIMLDYDSRLDLKIERDKTCNLSLRKATFFERNFLANWYYPNYAIRVAFKIALLSFGLGVISLIFGILSFI